MGYQEINAGVIDGWCREGWEWGQPISHQVYQDALHGRWEVYLTPTKPVPHAWFGELAGKRVLGLASGGGQLQAGFRLTDLSGAGLRLRLPAALRALRGTAGA